MLDRTTILSNLWRAKVLLGVADSLRPKPGGRDYSMELFVLLSDCYEPILDDLLLLSVVEIHAKAQLLRGGYAIHEISAPSTLRKRQKISPVHVRTLRAASRRGEDVTFREHTLGISVLLEKQYRDRYGLPDKVTGAVTGVRRRRNLVHFAEGYGWSLNHELLEFVEHLHAVVPTAKRRVK
jgi:hypothetical protein